MDAVVHFEMPYDDGARVAAFYRSAFGWSTQDTGAEMGHYVLATTSASGADGRPLTPGAINGGFFRRSADMPAQVPSVVISVDDIGKSMDKVRRAGGQVLGEPMEIPGVGRYVSFMDPEGNRVSMLQRTGQRG
jgi:predicted enzyme related to lactoylglutathione lyase